MKTKCFLSRIVFAVLGLFAVLITMSIAGVGDARAQSGTWTQEAPMPSAQTGSAVAYNGKLYVMDPTVSYMPVVYDPATNNWSNLTPNGLHRAVGSAGVIGNKIYVAEGWINSDSSSPTNALQIYDPATDSWTSGAPSLIARGNGASAVIGSKMYIAGGSNNGNSTKFDNLEIYDSTTNSWLQGAPLPQAVEYAAGAAINGKFYVVGGDYGPTNSNNTNSGFLFVYDPATNTWTTETSMPTPRDAPSAGVVNGKLFVVGGDADSGRSAALEIYDPATNTWSSGPSDLKARYFTTAGVIDSKLYVAGGYDVNGLVADLTVFGETCGWTSGASIPTGVIEATAAVSGGKLFVFGGSTGSGIAGTQVYDPAANTWSSKTPDPVSRGAASSGTIGGKIYVAEGWVGSDSNNPTSALRIYDPVTDTWAVGASSPIAKGASAGAVIGSKLYLAGGTRSGGSDKFSDLEIYDSTTDSWSSGSPLPIALEQAAGAAINGKFYVVGGDYGPNNVNNVVSNRLFIYDPATDSWVEGPSMSVPRNGLAAVAIGGKLYAIAGSHNGQTSTVEIYDPVLNTWTNGPSAPTARYLHVAGVIDSKVYVATGYNPTNVDSTVDILSGTCIAPTDTTPPVLSLPQDITAEASGPGGSVVNYIASAADDTDNDPHVICTPASGSTFAIGTTQVQCTATDASGNHTNGSFNVNVHDTTAPHIECGAPDGLWHGANVAINCTASDSASGLSDPASSSFTLATNVADGTEDANAATGSRQICDSAGNCATAGPVGGNKVDRKAPSISIIAPTNGNYLLNQTVTVSFSYQDGGSGIASFTTTTPNGGALDTATVGTKSFTVTATDSAGNQASQTVNYTVSYVVSPLFDQSRPVKAGGVIGIAVQLRDANGNNMSLPATVVHAINLVQVSSGASSVPEDPGNSNPDLDFRYVTDGGGSYRFNLKTTGLQTGTYRLFFQAAGGPLQFVDFQVRQ